jgi:hypothetical protein
VVRCSMHMNIEVWCGDLESDLLEECEADGRLTLRWILRGSSLGGIKVVQDRVYVGLCYKWYGLRVLLTET